MKIGQNRSNIDKSDLENKIVDADKKILGIVNFLKTNYNTKISETESRIPSIRGFATNFTLTAVENKVTDLSSFFFKKKTDYETKILEIKKKVTDQSDDKYITNSKFHNLTAKKKRKITERLAHANSITKKNFDNNLTNLNRKITQIKQNIYLL